MLLFGILRCLFYKFRTLNEFFFIFGTVVFCDSAFLILNGISKSIASSSSISLTSLNLSLSGGLYSSHTLIPPTPGPIAAINNFNVIDNIGTVPVTLDTFNISQYRTVKYLVEIKDKDLNKYLSQEILLVHDDQNVYMSEYGVIFTSADNFTTFITELDTNTGTVVLRCQCTGPNNVAKITRIVMTA